MKKLLSILLIFVVLFGVVACDTGDSSSSVTKIDTNESEAPECEHEWSEANCTTPKTCRLCKKTEGTVLAHDFADATCTASKTCKVCGATEGEALGHVWNNATCTTPKTCSTCGTTDGNALGHDLGDATCTEPATCKREGCTHTEGEANGHNYVDRICTVCGEFEYSSGLEFTSNGDGTCTVTGRGTLWGNNLHLYIPPKSPDGDIVTAIGERAFENFIMVSVTIPDSVVTIGNGAFFLCTLLESITIGKGITSIPEDAFNQCQNLKTVTIPDTVTSIGANAFAYCYDLQQIRLSSNLQSIGDSAFHASTSLSSITIPDSVTSIGEAAFLRCSGLTSITLGKGVATIGNEAFYQCTNLLEVVNNSNLSLTVGDSSHGYIAYYAFDIHTGEQLLVNQNDYLLYPYNGVIYLLKYLGKDLDLLLPDGYQGQSYEIAKNAFRSQSIKSIIIPDSVTSIGEAAFYNCSSLTSITIGKGVTSIGDSAFHQCYGLTSIALPNSVTSIGNSAFYFCNGLTGIVIPNNVTTIGNSAFERCGALAAISLGSSVTTIGANAFDFCKSLSSITIPDSVTSIGDYAFQFSGLTSVTIGSGLANIGTYVFYNCNALTSITIPGTVQSIGAFAFSCCSALTTVTIEQGVTNIGKDAFYKCPALTTVTIPKSVQTIEEYAFCECFALTDIYFGGLEKEWKAIDTSLACIPSTTTIHFAPCPHDWTDATCAAPKTCKICDATEGEALPHNWVNATLTAPKTCSECQAMTLQYDDYFPSLLSIPATKEGISIDGTALEITTVQGKTYFHAKIIGTATLKDGDKSYTVIIEKAKINVIVVMGQSNSVNWEDSVSGSYLFENAMTDVAPLLGTAYLWNNTSKKPVAFTETTRGLHSTLLAELYAQSVAAGNPTKNILIWVEGSTSKSGQSISYWATPTEALTPTLHTAKFVENCLAYYTKATNARKFSIESKGLYWLQGEIDGSTNAHLAIPGHTAMDPATYEASFMKMWETLAAQGLEYVAFLRVRRDVEDNKFPNADNPDHNDLTYTTALSAQLKMIAEHDNFYLATSLTENWVGTADTEHTIDISKYGSLMNEYSNGESILDKDGNVIATVSDGKLTTTMKDLYGSIAYCHYGKFGYTLIGADAAYNMYRALHGNSVAIIQGDTSGSPEMQTTATDGETKTIDSTKLTENLTFRAAAGSIAGTLKITVMMDDTDVTDAVMITEGAHVGALNAQKLKSYDRTTIIVTYTLTDGTVHTVTYECKDPTPFGDIVVVG